MRGNIVALTISMMGLTALSTIAVDRATAAPGPGGRQQFQHVQAPIYTVVTSRAGKKVIYPIEFGRINSSKGFVTEPLKWQTGNPPLVESNICASYNAGGNCGMKCAEGGGYHYYGMSCSADIFANGFDIVE